MVHGGGFWYYLWIWHWNNSFHKSFKNQEVFPLLFSGRNYVNSVLILLQIFVGSSSGTIWRFLSGKFLNWELSFLDTHMAPHYPCHVGRVRPAVALFACFLCFFVPLFSFSCLSLGNLNSFLEFHFKFSIVYY